MKKFIFIMAILAFTNANIAQANQDDETNITQVILKQWDKPESRLNVAPIVVAADYAMVGWTQGKKVVAHFSTNITEIGRYFFVVEMPSQKLNNLLKQV